MLGCKFPKSTNPSFYQTYSKHHRNLDIRLQLLAFLELLVQFNSSIPPLMAYNKAFR